MIQRCHNPNFPGFYKYGARGIRVCDRWRADFSAFHRDMGARPSDNHSIERKNNNGNYEPANCIWASRIVQANNKRNNHRLTVDGITLTLAEWARRRGFGCGVILDRVRRGWPADVAVLTPVMGFKGPGAGGRAIDAITAMAAECRAVELSRGVQL